MKKYSPADHALRIARNTYAGGGEAVKKVVKAIKAYHGSPHDFDKFDLSKIGTGEGAQAYGHGLYFADNEGVAKGYRDNLSKNTPTWKTPESAGKYDPSTLEVLQKELRYKTPDEVMALNKQYADHALETGIPNLMGDMHNALARGDLSLGKGHMYEVRINADPEHFLDWDKRLDQQSPEVLRKFGVNPSDMEAAWRQKLSAQDAIREKFPPADVFKLSDDELMKELMSPPNVDAATNQLYKARDEADSALMGFTKDWASRPDAPAREIIKGGDPVANTNRLREAGIPGIKYLDQGSRAAGDGSRNYVVFDDKIIDIAKKYGIGLPAAAALYQTMNPDGGQAQAAETTAPAAAPTNASQANGWNVGPSVAQQPTGVGAVSRQLSDWGEQTASDVGDIAKYTYNNPGKVADLAWQSTKDAAKWAMDNPGEAGGKAVEMVASGIPKFFPSVLWGPSGLLNPDPANGGEDTDALIARLKAKQAEQGQPDQSYRARAPSGVMNPLTAGATLGLGAAAASGPSEASVLPPTNNQMLSAADMYRLGMMSPPAAAPVESSAPAERPVPQPPRRPADLAPAPQRAPPDWGDPDSPAAFFRADKELMRRDAPDVYARGGPVALAKSVIKVGSNTYSPHEIRAVLQKIASMGINKDKMLAQITPREAAILKMYGGSGRINPRTGLLSFDDGGGGGDDSGGDDSGGDDSGGGGGGGGNNGDNDTGGDLGGNTDQGQNDQNGPSDLGQTDQSLNDPSNQDLSNVGYNPADQYGPEYIGPGYSGANSDQGGIFSNNAMPSISDINANANFMSDAIAQTIADPALQDQQDAASAAANAAHAASVSAPSAPSAPAAPSAPDIAPSAAISSTSFADPSSLAELVGPSFDMSPTAFVADQPANIDATLNSNPANAHGLTLDEAAMYAANPDLIGTPSLTIGPNSGPSNSSTFSPSATTATTANAELVSMTPAEIAATFPEQAQQTNVSPSSFASPSAAPGTLGANANMSQSTPGFTAAPPASNLSFNDPAVQAAMAASAQAQQAQNTQQTAVQSPTSAKPGGETYWDQPQATEPSPLTPSTAQPTTGAFGLTGPATSSTQMPVSNTPTPTIGSMPLMGAMNSGTGAGQSTNQDRALALAARAARQQSSPLNAIDRALGVATQAVVANDISDRSNYAGAGQPLSGPPQAVVFHHTADNHTAPGIVDTLNARHLGVQYVIDRNGVISQTLPAGSRGAHMLPSRINDLNNGNTIGVEVSAHDNRDVTPQQVTAAQALYNSIHSVYPHVQPFGHGELNPGHRQATEGMAIVNAIRNGSQPSVQASSPLNILPPAARNLSTYMGRDPSLIPPADIPNVPQRAYGGRVGYEEGGMPRDEDTYGPDTSAEDTARAVALSKSVNDRLAQTQPTREIQPDLMSTAAGEYPTGSNITIDELGRPLRNGQLTQYDRRPSILPFTRNDQGGIDLAMPRLADIASYIMGGVVAPVTARVGEAVLGAGPVRRSVDVAKEVAPAAKSVLSDFPDMFDFSRLREVPKVPQTDLPRYIPPQGVSQRTSDIISNPDVRNSMLETISNGEKMGGANWYNADPLRDEFIKELGVDAGDAAFKKYMDFVAATSPRSKVPENARNASYYYMLHSQGEPMPAVGTKNPQPYGHLVQRLHQMNAERVAGAGWDPLNNPKPASFVQNLTGNQQPVTVDTHAFRLPAILGQDPRFLVRDWETTYQPGTRWENDVFNPRLKEVRDKQTGELQYTKNGEPKSTMRVDIANGYKTGQVPMSEAVQNAAWWQPKPNNNEYGAMEKYYQGLGKELNLTPAQTQAAAWVGGGKLTGLGSDESKPFLRFFQDRVYNTAQETGMNPEDVLKYFIQGKLPLKSKGGAVDNAVSTAKKVTK